jgi:acetyltransferase-like isoleucine patch superfamily enzyme
MLRASRRRDRGRREERRRASAHDLGGSGLRGRRASGAPARTARRRTDLHAGHRRFAVEDAGRRGFSRHFVLVDQTAIVARSTSVGEGTFVNCGVVVGGAGRIGNFVVVNRSASVGHHARIADYVSIGPAAVLAGNVTLERGAVVGAGAIIAPEVTVGGNAVVSAGSVVVQDVLACSLVGGNPARVLRSAIAGYNDLAA